MIEVKMITQYGISDNKLYNRIVMDNIDGTKSYFQWDAGINYDALTVTPSIIIDRIITKEEAINLFPEEFL